MKLRAEVRRLVERIDAFPHGGSLEALNDEPPYFVITFKGGATRTVMISGESSGESNVDAAGNWVPHPSNILKGKKR